MRTARLTTISRIVSYSNLKTIWGNDSHEVGEPALVAQLVTRRPRGERGYLLKREHPGHEYSGTAAARTQHSRDVVRSYTSV